MACYASYNTRVQYLVATVIFNWIREENRISMTFLTIMTSNHLRSISFSGARGMFLDFKDYSLKLIICRSHLSNDVMCSVVWCKSTISKQLNACLSVRFRIEKWFPRALQKKFKPAEFSASGNSQALTGTARPPGALFLTVSEGGTKPKKLKIFPLPHKTPLWRNRGFKKQKKNAWINYH